MVAQVLTIAQQKGGAGKTTMAAHLAVAWAQYGVRVAVVDIDPQGSLTHWHDIRTKHAKRQGLVQLGFVQCSGVRMTREVEKLKRDYDLILIDSPPHTDSEARTAIRHCDLVIIPMQPSPLDLWATQATLKIAKQEKRPVKMVLNRVNPQAKLSQKMQTELKALSLSLFGNRVAYADALLAGKGVTELAPRSAAAEEIQALAEELLNHFGYEIREEELATG